MSIYREIKLEKLENLLEWLDAERFRDPDSAGEIDKLIKRIEQQMAFLRFETYSDVK